MIIYLLIYFIIYLLINQSIYVINLFFVITCLLMNVIY
jgi:hypothetical protein